MAFTFTIPPSYRPVSARTPRILSARFGDGYEQRGADGINPDLQSWRVNFGPRETLDIDLIEALFTQHNTTVSPFLWTPPRIQPFPTRQSFASSVTPIDSSWRSVAFGNGVYCAISDTGGISEQIMTSVDGVTWTLRTAAANNGWTAICWDPYRAQFVCVANTGANRVQTSPDGVNWTIRTCVHSNDWRAVTASPTVLVATAVTGTGNRVMWSSDGGASWTLQTGIPADSNWGAVVWTGAKFVAVASSGTIGQKTMWSLDGVTWTLVAAAHDDTWFSLATNGLADPDNVCVAGSNGASSTRIMRSTNHGLTWVTNDEAANLSWIGACWTGTVFVFVSNTGTNNRIMSSPDGLTWTGWATPNDRAWQAIASNGRTVVAVANGGGAGLRALASIATPGLYLCRSWSRTALDFNLDELTATFEEVADPS